MSKAIYAKSISPYIYVLGVGQDAGFPQAGCFKERCNKAWLNQNLKRTATSIAVVDQQAHHSYLFEATPDFPQQYFALEQVAPKEKYHLNGIFLTHAHIGHYTGLMYLGHEAMGAKNVPVYAMPRMKNFLAKNAKTESFSNINVTPFLVPHRDEYSETVGYRIEGPNKSAIFIPDINKWSVWNTDIAELVKSVDYALIDATFYHTGELPGRDMSKVPHPLVTDSMARFDHLTKEQKQKVWFIHMNHTNPMFNNNSEASKQVKAAGFNIASEGIKLVL